MENITGHVLKSGCISACVNADSAKNQIEPTSLSFTTNKPSTRVIRYLKLSNGLQVDGLRLMRRKWRCGENGERVGLLTSAVG